MTTQAPPNGATPQPTGGLVSENAAHAAAAIRRAGHNATPRNIRVVLRHQRDTAADHGNPPRDEAAARAWWDALMTETPLGLTRPRSVLKHKWAVAS